MQRMTQPLPTASGAEYAVDRQTVRKLTEWLRLAQWQAVTAAHRIGDAAEAQAVLDDATADLAEECGQLWTKVLAGPLQAWHAKIQHGPAEVSVGCTVCDALTGAELAEAVR